MDKKKKAGPLIAGIASKIVVLLEPLDRDDRNKVINGVLAMLGEATIGEPPGGVGTDDGKDPDLDRLSLKAKTWMRQNGLAISQIEQVFDITSEGATVIASEAPGSNDKERTHNAYVLQGISRFLASGDPTFDDKAARKVCLDLGCYQATNHSTYMSDKANLLTGSKRDGWKLTAPGLKHGAELVKRLTAAKE